MSTVHKKGQIVKKRKKVLDCLTSGDDHYIGGKEEKGRNRGTISGGCSKKAGKATKI